MKLSKLKKLTDSDQREYGKSLTQGRPNRSNESYEIKFAGSIKRTLNWVNFLYATQAFPVWKGERLEVSLSENDPLNGSLTALDKEGSSPRCQMDWSGLPVTSPFSMMANSI